MAAERTEGVGKSIGYKIRLETRQSQATKLLFCTTGVLLRKLADDRDLSNVSHIVVDEVCFAQPQLCAALRCAALLCAALLCAALRCAALRCSAPLTPSQYKRA